MTEQAYMSEESMKRERWWMHHSFPLVPFSRYRPANEHGASSYYFQWLFFSLWTNIAPEFGLHVGVNDRHLFAMLTLPYLHVMLSLNGPRYFHHKLWRKGTGRY